MTILGYVITILGVASISVNLMRLIERIDRPEHMSRRTA